MFAKGIVPDLVRVRDAIVKKREAIEKRYRISDPVFHHAFVASYDGIGMWGAENYRVCTNLHGFKRSCNAPAYDGKDYDIAFIGDSFTEGIGLSYEDTFVGKIAAALSSLKIANLGVSSYAPSIYLSKLNKLLNDGFVVPFPFSYPDFHHNALGSEPMAQQFLSTYASREVSFSPSDPLETQGTACLLRGHSPSSAGDWPWVM